jgi:hypothetical protein
MKQLTVKGYHSPSSKTMESMTMPLIIYYEALCPFLLEHSFLPSSTLKAGMKRHTLGR